MAIGQTLSPKKLALRIQRIRGLAANSDELRDSEPTLQWAGLKEVIHTETATKIMELSLEVLNLKEFCSVKTEASAEDVPRVIHEYIFHNSWLIMTDAMDASGKKLTVSLDGLEK